ncbi:MAG: biosynthetic arginine decarboxylase [Gammaproteobacteria bacterium]|nr:biosynthetic arginine decarboxylase [Gammaproteobacteria bacterium]
MWTIQDARNTYNIAHWGNGYFDIADNGHLLARPDRNPEHPGIDLYQLANDIRATELSLPVLVRFNDILHDRVSTLVNAFDRAMEDDHYQGRYTAVYPIKVNQQRSVVEQILAGGQGHVGLEAGSKPELMAVLAVTPSGGTVICNGYKDREYIRLALIGQALGHRVHIVVEKLSELELILNESRELGIKPLLGVRVRLASIGAGNWQNTGGEKSKFGLSSSQVLQVVDLLQQAGVLDSLKLLHFHLGSQIANIRDIQRGMREAARFYTELLNLNVPVSTVDVGGGLGVDYDGTRSHGPCSMNYTMQEYAHNVVHTLKEICDEQGLPHPDIISESGRAMTAHHAMLIAPVIDLESVPEGDNLPPTADADPQVLKDLGQTLARLNQADETLPVLDIYHDATHWQDEAQKLYSDGALTLEQRARTEQYYAAICHRIRKQLKPSIRTHREALDQLNEKLADKYFCNFSLFQSLPDVWGIDQIFPIMPLHRLDEKPDRRGILQDLTCDSDGRIDYYVDNEGVEGSLPLHHWDRDQPYLLGFFLIGAYQEILGDMHNLFGDTDSVNVVLDGKGAYQLEESHKGDGIDDLLRYVHFEPAALLEAYGQKVAQAKLDEATAAFYLQTLQAGLSGYTYLEE